MKLRTGDPWMPAGAYGRSLKARMSPRGSSVVQAGCQGGRDMQLSVLQTGFCRAAVAMAMLIVAATAAFANGEIVTREESTSIVVPLIISALGGAVAILGVLLAARGGRAASGLRITFGKDKTLTLTKLTQGVVIVLIGAAILIAGLYNLPKTKKEETIKAKTIEEKDGKKIYRN